MPAFERLLVVRHGACAYEASGRPPGLVDSELTPEGEAAAEAAAAVVAAQPWAVHEVLSSPLERAARTARAIARTCPGRPPVRAMWQLADRHVGRLSADGLLAHDAADALDAAPPGLSTDDPLWWPVSTALQQWPSRYRPEAESLADVLARVRALWTHHLYARPGTGAVVLVSHDVPLRALRVVVEGLSDDAMRTVGLRPGQVLAYDFAGGELSAVTHLRPGTHEDATGH
jgi:broad specificity phosphatase PhoE